MGELSAHPFFLRQLVDPAGASGKLKPLSPGIDEKGDLARIAPPWDASRLKVHKVFEKGTDQGRLRDLDNLVLAVLEP